MKMKISQKNSVLLREPFQAPLALVRGIIERRWRLSLSELIIRRGVKIF